jgi:tetratricopeptide (TPR) repeat protein
MTNHYLKKREFGEAVALMRQVTRLRRNADDWQNLGQYEQLLGNNDRAAKALSMALEIDPSRVYLKQILEAQPR